jgi:hypothetical protein
MEKAILRTKSIGTKVSDDEYAQLEKLAEARGLAGYIANEFNVDGRVQGQHMGISQQGFREGLEPRQYATPTNPEAVKPQQK